MMFVVSLIEFSKHVQNEISAKVMPKPQNFTADFADEMKLRKATVSRLAKQMIKAGKIIKKNREYFLKGGAKNDPKS
jgi:predicted transcriptional regulator